MAGSSRTCRVSPVMCRSPESERLPDQGTGFVVGPAVVCGRSIRARVDSALLAAIADGVGEQLAFLVELPGVRADLVRRQVAGSCQPSRNSLRRDVT